MSDLRYPNITGTTPEQQLSQLKSYLHQLVRELNRKLEELETAGSRYEI